MFIIIFAIFSTLNLYYITDYSFITDYSSNWKKLIWTAYIWISEITYFSAGIFFHLMAYNRRFSFANYIDLALEPIVLSGIFCVGLLVLSILAERFRYSYTAKEWDACFEDFRDVLKEYGILDDEISFSWIRRRYAMSLTSESILLDSEASMLSFLGEHSNISREHNCEIRLKQCGSEYEINITKKYTLWKRTSLLEIVLLLWGCLGGNRNDETHLLHEKTDHRSFPFFVL